jgi:hypothetical protein
MQSRTPNPSAGDGLLCLLRNPGPGTERYILGIRKATASENLVPLDSRCGSSPGTF